MGLSEDIKSKLQDEDLISTIEELINEAYKEGYNKGKEDLFNYVRTLL